MTRRPVPDELVQAVHDAFDEWRPDYPWPVGDPVIVIHVALAAVPDGWAKEGGSWRHGWAEFLAEYVDANYGKGISDQAWEAFCDRP